WCTAASGPWWTPPTGKGWRLWRRGARSLRGWTSSTTCGRTCRTARRGSPGRPRRGRAGRPRRGRAGRPRRGRAGRPRQGRAGRPRRGRAGRWLQRITRRERGQECPVFRRISRPKNPTSLCGGRPQRGTSTSARGRRAGAGAGTGRRADAMRNGHDLERTPCRTGVVSRARRATDSTTFIGRQGEETMGTIVPETQGWVRDLEAVVGRIRAVAAARVVVDANDNIETIHVLAGRTRTAEQILADIQS